MSARSVSSRLAVALLSAALVACAPGRTFEALDVLRDIASGAGPSRLKATAPAPRKTTLAYCAAGARRVADLYVAGTPKAGLVLVPGVARAGKDAPRLVAFARTLARARFMVLVPDIANLRALRARGAGRAR